MADKAFTEAQHRAYAAMLRHMDNDLLDLTEEVARTYGKKDPLVRRLEDITDALLKVRADLSSRLMNEHDPADWARVYLGGALKRSTPSDG